MNKIQSEAQLENNLISQLQGLEYEKGMKIFIPYR
jgi:hypothetical protein